jgi:hypothetical protein
VSLEDRTKREILARVRVLQAQLAVSTQIAKDAIALLEEHGHLNCSTDSDWSGRVGAFLKKTVGEPG